MKKIFGIYISIPAIFRNRYKYYTHSRKINLETAREYCKRFINKVCDDSQELNEYKDQKLSELEEKLNRFESSLINDPFFDYLHKFPRINVHLGKKDVGYPKTSRWGDLGWKDAFIELKQTSKGYEWSPKKPKPPKIKLTLGIQPVVYGMPAGDGGFEHYFRFYSQFTKAKKNFTKILKIIPSASEDFNSNYV